MIYVFKTRDHPESNGRLPKAGEQAWNVWFPLEDGGKLYVHMGAEGHRNLREVVLMEYLDDVIDSYNHERGYNADVPAIPESPPG
jgi:hypothetical protein